MTMRFLMTAIALLSASVIYMGLAVLDRGTATDASLGYSLGAVSLAVMCYAYSRKDSHDARP